MPAAPRSARRKGCALLLVFEVTRPAGRFHMPQDALLAQAGTRLGAHHMALLAQFFKDVPLHRKPVLGVLSTGDEFCGSAPQSGLAACQSNTNALLLEGLAASLGANCLHLGTAPDNAQALGQHLRAAVPGGPTPCDVIVVIGGSSGGKRDFSAQAIAGLPGCNICGNDQRVSSGRPLTLARVGQTAIWGLPGHSLSLALAAQVFLAPLLQKLAGQQTLPQHMNRQPSVLARLGLALPVEGNAPTHYPVMLRPGAGLATAWPVVAGTGKTVVLRDMRGAALASGCTVGGAWESMTQRGRGAGSRGPPPPETRVSRASVQSM